VTVFVVLGAVLIAGALLFVVPPLLRRGLRTGETRDAVNVAVYRDQLRELEADLRAGTLAPDQHVKARGEIEARLLADVGKGDALAALLKEQVAAVRKAEPGCLVYRPHRSTKDPDLFIFYEQYKDDAAFDVHRKAPYLAAYRERREKEGLTEGATEVEFFRSLTD